MVLYEKLCEIQLMRTQWISPFSLRSLIKEQCQKFPKSSTFDFRSLSASEPESLYKVTGQFLLPNLLEFFEQFAQIRSNSSTAKQMKIQMLISILCSLVDRRSCFLQTLLGLFAYAYGLRDKGFAVLGSFGCLPSIRHIRNHGNFWAKKRNVIDEIDPCAFWRVTFDNLDFKMSY